MVGTIPTHLRDMVEEVGMETLKYYYAAMYVLPRSSKFQTITNERKRNDRARWSNSVGPVRLQYMGCKAVRADNLNTASL